MQVEPAEISINAQIPIRKDLLPQEAPEFTSEQEQDYTMKAVHERILLSFV
jgi:hypothetical protein